MKKFSKETIHDTVLILVIAVLVVWWVSSITGV